MKPRSKKPGNKNLIGAKVLVFRLNNNIKQKDFLAQLQVLGLDITNRRFVGMMNGEIGVI